MAAPQVNAALKKVRDDMKLFEDGKKGVIVSRKEGKGNGFSHEYAIKLEDGSEVSATRDELEVIRPAKKDKLIIIKGELAGQVGTLIGIDGADGIVKMAANADIKILDLEICAKLDAGLG